MKNLKLKFALFFCLSILLFIADKSFAGDKVTLKLHLKKGDVFLYNMSTVQTVSQTIKGQDVDMNQTMSFGYLMEVKDVDGDGNYDINATYDKIKISMKSKMGMSEDYNSDDTTATVSSAGKIYGALKGYTLKITLTPMGKVTKINGINELIDKMISSMGLEDKNQEKTVRTTFQSLVGEDAMKQAFGNGFDVFPDGPVSIGSTWTKEMDIKVISSMHLKNEYKVTDIKDNKVYFEVKSAISTDPNAKGIEMMGMSMNYKLKGTQKGNSELEISSGMVIKSQLMQDITGTVSIIGMSDDGKDNGCPIAILSTVTITTDKK